MGWRVELRIRGDHLTGKVFVATATTTLYTGPTHDNTCCSARTARGSSPRSARCLMHSLVDLKSPSLGCASFESCSLKAEV